MEQNIILAGVGGQGILTIAKAISLTALRNGLNIKQAEVHGMAQRGGAVHSHLRISTDSLHSDLIPVGRADLIIATEPLEALRYVHYLKPEGALLSGTNAFANIEHYPPVEELLARIADFPRHVLLDVARIARAAGSLRSANMVLLGAASPFLDLNDVDLRETVESLLAGKGASAGESARRAFDFGRNAACAYRDALRKGLSPADARRWMDSLPTIDLGITGCYECGLPAAVAAEETLSSAEAEAVDSVLRSVRERNRDVLFEHEVYSLVELVGAISPPLHRFLPIGEAVTCELLSEFPGNRVALKLVSPKVIHKTDADGLAFVDRNLPAVQRAVRELTQRHADDDVAGVLIVEFVDRPNRGFGDELFVGIRATREFGPILAAGLGGIDTEYLAGVMRPGLAVAKAVAADVTAETFLELFRTTSAYDILAGRARGHRRVVSDGDLLRCFRAFLAIARRFCVARDDGGPSLAELEVNPFAFRRQAMVPLDGRGRLGEPARPSTPRPRESIDRLLEPRTIAVLGVSADSMNPGRVILNNIKACGFPTEKLWVIKPGCERIDGVPCADSPDGLPEVVDLMIVAAPAKNLPDIVRQIGRSNKVRSAILISGGVGEVEGTESSLDELRRAILAARKADGDGPVFLGPNSLGVRSHAGHYDTFFIPPGKIDTRFLRSQDPPARLAFISQSGAFILSRLSNLEVIRPAFAISIGNQADLTLSDLVGAMADRGDIDVIAVYAEGFRDLDGEPLLRAIERARAAGKVALFYRAGRTPAGVSAAAGHTAAVAGDHEVCQAAAAQAGAIVVDTFKEFEQLMELSVALHGKRIGGRRIGAITNAGAEAVAMADSVRGARYLVEMAALGEADTDRLRHVLHDCRLESLVNPRNPLDLTPMAGEDAYEACGRLLLESPDVDALVTAVVPLTPTLLTTPEEIAKSGSLVEVVAKLFRESDKPVIFVVDCGPLYDPLALAIRRAGIPVFRSCDQAIRSLGRYLCHRAPQPAPESDRVRPRTFNEPLQPHRHQPRPVVV